VPLTYHFSVDDVLAGLLDETHPLLDLVAGLRDRHGTRADLYVFHRGTTGGTPRALDAIPPTVAARLARLDWLGLGPHADDYATAPHAQSLDEQRAMLERVYGALDRAAPGSGRARWLRLHYFSECFELAPELRARGVETLLTTDKPAGAYRLPPARREELLRDGATAHGGLRFVRTDLRLENLARDAAAPGDAERRLDALLAARERVVLFTHEVDLADEGTRAMAHRCLSHLARAGARPL
jgi:hypothetical protein